MLEVMKGPQSIVQLAASGIGLHPQRAEHRKNLSREELDQLRSFDGGARQSIVARDLPP